MYHSILGDLPRSFSDGDDHRERTRGRGAQKCLRESCCHRIECSAANFLAAFMLKIPLNSAALAIPTHRGPERVSNGTSTQIVVYMINKCRVKIVKRGLYNVRDPQWRGDRKKEEKHCSN